MKSPSSDRSKARAVFAETVFVLSAEPDWTTWKTSKKSHSTSSRDIADLIAERSRSQKGIPTNSDAIERSTTIITSFIVTQATVLTDLQNQTLGLRDYTGNGCKDEVEEKDKENVGLFMVALASKVLNSSIGVGLREKSPHVVALLLDQGCNGAMIDIGITHLRAKALLYFAKMQWALQKLEEPDSAEWELTPGHGRSTKE
ncbi:MAG: hypothetical protein Q9180_006855 [Flavoplaca navasiana]